MTGRGTDGPADREDRLHAVLLEFVEAAEAGRATDRRRLLAENPDLRRDLEEFFSTHDELERLAAPLRETAKERPGPAAEPPAADLGQLGDFRLLREVGRGGMGVVYEAEQISLRRRVALKVLPFAAAIDPRHLERFQNEAQAAARLRHENVVPVYAVGSERGVHYYAMQFIEGQSLSALIDELRRHADRPAPGDGDTAGRTRNAARAETLPDGPGRFGPASLSRERSSGSRWYFDWVAGLGRQAATALEHAHQMGIVHRDVKPANLLLDPRGQLWITDFGLAQISSDTGLTITGEVLGTLRYASPEQVLGRRGLVDHRSDVYALGATLYELLTLRPPFDGRDRHELLRQLAQEEPPPPRALDKAIPAELETVLLKALAKEPGERYATARDLADDLQRFREDRPVRARRPSLREKATKWARRHKAVVVSVVGTLLLVVIALAAATALTARAYDRERQKAAEAAEQRARADEQRARAEESFRQARRAVEELAQIGEEEAADNPEVERLRWRLLKAALTYYQDFIEQHGDDPSIQKELEASRAKAETILGELTTLMGVGRYVPLHQKGVQDELDLSAEQRQALAQINRRWWEGLRDSHRQAAGEWERRRLALARDQEKQVARLLSPAQQRRFKELALQYLGGRALSDPDVAEALGLTAEQKQRIRSLQDWGRRTKFGPRGHDDPARDTNARLWDVLTARQQARWAELTGEPFDGELGPGCSGRLGPPPESP